MKSEIILRAVEKSLSKGSAAIERCPLRSIMILLRFRGNGQVRSVIVTPEYELNEQECENGVDKIGWT